MFRVKICGITTIDDARMAAAAGADAIGLNFCPRSPRFVSFNQAVAICEALPRRILKIGVYVNSPSDQVLLASTALRLDAVQLHGDEPPPAVCHLLESSLHLDAVEVHVDGEEVPESRRLSDWELPRKSGVIKGFRLGGEGLRPAVEYLERCRQLKCLPTMVLLDSFRKGQYGGTGRLADWSQAARYPLAPWHPPLVLAGGLTPENVAEAIQAVHPYAVDTASGVESSPGRKDPELVKRFVAAARAAFEHIP